MERVASVRTNRVCSRSDRGGAADAMNNDRGRIDHPANVGADKDSNSGRPNKYP
jgi:hypothetical protein